MPKKYAISDIHGCLKTFKSLLTKLNYSQKDELYILGDFKDRGPDSKGVIDYIWELRKSGYHVHCTRGNHDQMMLDARDSLKLQRKWLMIGGQTTVENFDAHYIQDIPSRYFQFFEEMPLYLEVDNYILVHAGFKFDMPNPFNEHHSMLWQREWYGLINYHWLGNRIIVHGHTPLTKSEITSMLNDLDKNKYIDIDCGCVHKGRLEGLGYLTCLILNENKLVFEKNIDF